MNLFVPLLLIPFCLGAGLAMVWVHKRLPPGWKGVGLGFAALGGVSILAFGGWMFSLTLVTWAHYCCTDCGRVEKQTHVGTWVVSRELEREDDEYLKRFAPSLLRGHEHHWHLESCLYNYQGVGCTMQRVGGWFEVLPRLADHPAAEALYREAQALPYDERCRLMDEFSYLAYEVREGMDADSALAKWRAERPK